MQIDPLSLILPLLAGVFIGFIYFTMMYFSMKYMVKAQKPARVLMFGALSRLIFAGVAFYLVMGDRWENIAAALVGFIIARTIFIKQSLKLANKKEA